MRKAVVGVEHWGFIMGQYYNCSNRERSGEVHHSRDGQILLGEYSKLNDTRTVEIASRFRDAGVEYRIVSDLKHAR
jgi:ketopantoate reductase